MHNENHFLTMHAPFELPLHRSGRVLFWTLAVVLIGPVTGTWADLRLEPTILDFGDRGHQEQPSKTLTIENSGTTPSRILSIRASCGCLRIEPPALERQLAPKERVELTVTMSSGRAMGVLDKYVELKTDDPAQPSLKVRTRMRVFPDIEMEPRSLRLEGIFGGKPLLQTVDVTWANPRIARGPMRLELAGIREALGRRAVNPHFEGRVVDIPNGKRVELTLKPTHPEGRIWSELELKLDGRSLVLPLTGEMFRWIKISPREFNFSRVSTEQPESFRQEVVLSSTDDRAFSIREVLPTFTRKEPSDARLDVELVDSKLATPARRHVLRARIQSSTVDTDERFRTRGARARGSFSGKVIVRTDHPDRPEVTLLFFGFFDAPR